MARNLDDCLPFLVMLTRATRVATEHQLDAFAQLYPAFRGSCQGALARLVLSGHLTCHDMSIRVPAIDVPLFSWHVGDPAPDSDALASQLIRRSTIAPWRRLRLYWATRKAVALVGGVSGLNRQPLQLQHDLGTTEAYLRFLEQAVEQSEQSEQFWVGEDVLRQEFPHLFKGKRPDAAILAHPDQPIRIIETGGTYSADDLRHIHRSYARERTAYELW